LSEYRKGNRSREVLDEVANLIMDRIHALAPDANGKDASEQPF
jgi:hypothetical protein